MAQICGDALKLITAGMLVKVQPGVFQVTGSHGKSTILIGTCQETMRFSMAIVVYKECKWVISHPSRWLVPGGIFFVPPFVGKIVQP